MKIITLIRRVARKYRKRPVSKDEAEHVLWEFTGYPAFWRNSKRTPAQNLTTQLHEYFRAPRKARREHDAELMAFVKGARK